MNLSLPPPPSHSLPHRCDVLCERLPHLLRLLDDWPEHLRALARLRDERVLQQRRRARALVGVLHQALGHELDERAAPLVWEEGRGRSEKLRYGDICIFYGLLGKKESSERCFSL